MQCDLDSQKRFIDKVDLIATSSRKFPYLQPTMSHTDIPNALEKIKAREKDVPWYDADIGNKLGDSARELLENYSNIPAAEVENHVYKIVILRSRTRDSRLTLHDSAMKRGLSGHTRVSVASGFLTCTSKVTAVFFSALLIVSQIPVATL
jgi:hypothetical protein